MSILGLKLWLIDWVNLKYIGESESDIKVSG